MADLADVEARLQTVLDPYRGRLEVFAIGQGGIFNIWQVVLRGADGSLWLFWRRSVGNPGLDRYQLFYRRIFPSI